MGCRKKMSFAGPKEADCYFLWGCVTSFFCLFLIFRVFYYLFFSVALCYLCYFFLYLHYFFVVLSIHPPLPLSHHFPVTPLTYMFPKICPSFLKQCVRWTGILTTQSGLVVKPPRARDALGQILAESCW